MSDTNCPSREAGKHHCDHALGYVLTSNPPQQPYQCCFCGRVRTVEMQTSGGITYNPKDHGPFVFEVRYG